MKCTMRVLLDIQLFDVLKLEFEIIYKVNMWYK